MASQATADGDMNMTYSQAEGFPADCIQIW